MDKKDEWQRIKNDPELLEAARARARHYYRKNIEKERVRSHLKYEKNKEKELIRHRKFYAEHRERWREYGAKKRIEHGERERAQDREWYDKNKEKVAEKNRKYRAGPHREQYLKVLRYGAHKHYLSREKYEEIYPRLLVGPCDICGVAGEMKIDHCHKQNVFRGILCDQCNRGIGFLRDNPRLLRRAAEYLERDELTTGV